MLIVTIQVNAPPGAAECVKEVLGMALEQLGDARVRHDGFPWEVDAWMPMPDRRPPEGEEDI